MLLLLGCALGAAACDRTAAVPPPALSPVAFPLTVSDALGRRLTLPAPPQRLVSLAPSLTETLFALGAGERLVGVTLYDDYPPQVQRLPRVGGYVAASISIEKILSLRPDLVLAYGELQYAVVEALARRQVPVAALLARCVEEVYATTLLLGRLTGQLRQAHQVVAAMQQRVARVQARVAAIPPEKRVRVFYAVQDEPLITAGPQTFLGQLLTLAGGLNIFADLQARYAPVSAEEVVRRNPEVILGPDHHGQPLRRLAQQPGWQHVAAVRQGRIYLLDGDLVSRPGPRLAAALEAVVQALYPQYFPGRQGP
ncbi:MAG: ABC transporter substrate-binding protein [Candidatus Tectimicrobiota bacterium]|nr:MAG: ABC transporter substrate-binding protein [Candidatus Tectomicrobia bacterium]